VKRHVERTGFAEVLVRDKVLVVGGYRLNVESELASAAPDEAVFLPVRARGTIRLDRSQPILSSLAEQTVSVRFDRAVTVSVDVHLYVRSAGLLAFTCRDPEPLAALVRQGPLGS
jgi:hypothetical protein